MIHRGDLTDGYGRVLCAVASAGTLLVSPDSADAPIPQTSRAAWPASNHHNSRACPSQHTSRSAAWLPRATPMPAVVLCRMLRRNPPTHNPFSAPSPVRTSAAAGVLQQTCCNMHACAQPTSGLRVTTAQAPGSQGCAPLLSGGAAARSPLLCRAPRSRLAHRCCRGWSPPTPPACGCTAAGGPPTPTAR